VSSPYRLTRKDGAPGIDGVTADDYATNLDANLLDLLDRIKSGRYQAPPVRRANIPKTDGSWRPLGIPTFEDKARQCRALSSPSVRRIGANIANDFPNRG
jgi:RNA-directed DNA polymerase